MLTLSFPPPIRFIVESPPAIAPTVLIPLIFEILWITSSDACVNSSKVSFSPSFAEIVTESWFVSISISIKFKPFESDSAALAIRRTTAIISTSGLKRRHHSSTLPYHSRTASNHGWRISFVFLSVTEAIAGTNVNATTRLAARVYAIVRARSTNSCRVIPSVKIIGAKTLIVVSVDAMIAPVTCFDPSTAAFRME